MVVVVVVVVVVKAEEAASRGKKECLHIHTSGLKMFKIFVPFMTQYISTTNEMQEMTIIAPS